MIVFKYTKKDGAEYLAHLDMLRHLNKIMRRANIPTGYSKGFNPHMSLFMSAPIGVGIKSEAEFCLVESQISAEEFKKAFNDYTIKGVTCDFAISVNKKVSVAGLLNRATYEIEGLNDFNVNEVISQSEFYCANKKGELKEVRSKIFDLHWDGKKMIATLGFGNEGLRPDLLAKKLAEIYGGEVSSVVKKQVWVNDIRFEDYLLEFKA